LDAIAIKDYHFAISSGIEGIFIDLGVSSMQA
jgi:16S rRNA C1402 N4-methylase RsmH